MRAIGNKIGVVFDDNHLKTYDLGNGIKLHRAETWVGKEGDEEGFTKTESNVNHLETNPQIGWVVMPNDKYDLKVGDKVFMHYLAFEEFEEKIEIDGKDCYLIEENFIFFTMENGEYKMRPNTYLGTIIINEPPKSTFGIYLTSQDAFKNDLKISITHSPIPVTNEHGVFIENVCKVGDIVMPIDRSNYPLTVDEVEYVMLKDTEIVAIYGTESKA